MNTSRTVRLTMIATRFGPSRVLGTTRANTTLTQVNVSSAIPRTKPSIRGTGGTLGGVVAPGSGRSR